MPYKIVKKGGERPYKIVKADTGKVVGSSTSKAKASRSIGYREEAKREKPAGMAMFPNAQIIKNERIPRERPMRAVTFKEIQAAKRKGRTT